MPIDNDFHVDVTLSFICNYCRLTRQFTSNSSLLFFTHKIDPDQLLIKKNIFQSMIKDNLVSNNWLIYTEHNLVLCPNCTNKKSFFFGKPHESK